MASSTSSGQTPFSAITACPTVQGEWTIENFPALIRTAMTTTGRLQSTVVASCSFPMKCQCVGGCVKVKVYMKYEGAGVFRQQRVSMYMKLLEQQDSGWRNRIGKWMGNFQFFVDLGGRAVLASNEPDRMFDCMRYNTEDNGQEMFNVCDMEKLVDAQGKFNLRIKIKHGPCAAVENSVPAGVKDAAAALSPASMKERVKVEVKSGSQTLVKYGSFPDFLIKVNLGGKKSFQVHRKILTERSLVLWGLFEDLEDDPQEPTVATVLEVQDISAQTMEYFLDYLYFDSFSGDESSWVSALPDIAEAADKYRVMDLLEFCDKNLHWAVNERNALAIMKRANRLGLKTAEANIGEYIREHSDAVLRNGQP